MSFAALYIHYNVVLRKRHLPQGNPPSSHAEVPADQDKPFGTQLANKYPNSIGPDSVISVDR